MKKQRVLIIVLMIIIALLVIYIFWGQNYLPIPAQMTAPGATGAVSSQDEQAGVSDNPDAVVISPTSTVIYSPAPSDLYTDVKKYSGEYLEMTGTIYGDPNNIEGMLSFYIQTDDNQYASINFLDMNETMDLSNGEKVAIKGIVSNSVKAENSNGLLIDMPMIEANYIEKVN